MYDIWQGVIWIDGIDRDMSSRNESTGPLEMNEVITNIFQSAVHRVEVVMIILFDRS